MHARSLKLMVSGAVSPVATGGAQAILWLPRFLSGIGCGASAAQGIFSSGSLDLDTIASIVLPFAGTLKMVLGGNFMEAPLCSCEEGRQSDEA